MMEASINQCPDNQWDNRDRGNRFWHIAYHALYFTNLYCSPSEDAVRHWEKSEQWKFILGKWAQAPEYDPEAMVAYTKVDVLEYLEFVRDRVVTLLHEEDLSGESGFSWLTTFDRFGVWLYNLRHFQHHIGQLTERVRADTRKGVQWIGRG